MTYTTGILIFDKLEELDAIGPVVILNFLLRSHLLALVAHAGATR